VGVGLVWVVKELLAASATAAVRAYDNERFPLREARSDVTLSLWKKDCGNERALSHSRFSRANFD
jgi:hypothetical protein